MRRGCEGGGLHAPLPERTRYRCTRLQRQHAYPLPSTRGGTRTRNAPKEPRVLSALTFQFVYPGVPIVAAAIRPFCPPSDPGRPAAADSRVSASGTSPAAPSPGACRPGSVRPPDHGDVELWRLQPRKPQPQRQVHLGPRAAEMSPRSITFPSPQPKLSRISVTWALAPSSLPQTNRLVDSPTAPARPSPLALTVFSAFTTRASGKARWICSPRLSSLQTPSVGGIP